MVSLTFQDYNSRLAAAAFLVTVQFIGDATVTETIAAALLALEARVVDVAEMFLEGCPVDLDHVHHLVDLETSVTHAGIAAFGDLEAEQTTVVSVIDPDLQCLASDTTVLELNHSAHT